MLKLKREINVDKGENNMENMKDISIHKRPNIGVEDMGNYENGGLCIDSMERNGLHLYVPYGVWCDLFNAMDVGTRVMHDRIRELKKLIHEGEEMQEKFPQYKTFYKSFKEQIEMLEKQISIFDVIAPLREEV